MRRATATTSAFTLVELLAATALCALLTLAVLKVVVSTVQTETAMKRQEQQHGWPARLAEKIRWDLSNADAMEVEEDELVLLGHGSLDRRTLTATHLPAEVSYRVERKGAASLLVRKQKTLDSVGKPIVWTELLCDGVAAVTLLRVETEHEAASAIPLTSGPAPDRLKLVVTSSQAGRPPLEQVMVLR